MFRDSIQKMIDRVDGGVAGILMGYDGISVESYTKTEETTDIQTVGMELSHVITQFRRAAELLYALNEEYFIAFALRPEGNFGKARYLLRLLAPEIQSEL